MNNAHQNWLYFKIYVEPPLQNRFLLDYVYPVLNDHFYRGTIGKWFFIRYHDEYEARDLSIEKNTSDNEAISKLTNHGHHLRVRLQIIPAFLQEVQETLTNNLKQAYAAGYCTYWDTFCYIPEINRYGGVAGINLAQEIFYLNSHDIIVLFRLYSGNVVTEFLIQLGDKLLQNLGLDEEARTHLYFQRFQWFASVYHFDTTDYEHLEKLYTKLRQRLEETFAQAISAKLIADQFLQSNIRMSNIGIEFSRLEKDGRLTFSKVDILAALHHMHCNRAGFSSFKELSTLYCMYRWLKDRRSG